MKHHEPIVHGLHLATHEAVGDAWQLFFERCMELAEVVRQRRAAKQTQGESDEKIGQDCTALDIADGVSQNLKTQRHHKEKARCE